MKSYFTSRGMEWISHILTTYAISQTTPVRKCSKTKIIWHIFDIQNDILSKELFIWHLDYTKYTKTRTPQSVVVMEPSTSPQILRSPIGRALDFQAGGPGSIPGAGSRIFFIFLHSKRPLRSCSARSCWVSEIKRDGSRRSIMFQDLSWCPTLSHLVIFMCRLGCLRSFMHAVQL